MKSPLTLIYLTFITIFVAAFPLHANSAETTTIKIVYISKIPNIEPLSEGTGGLAELGAMLKQIREENDHVLFLHGGDSLAPSALSSFDHGTHMIDILNSLEPDLMAVNERELAYGEDELILRIGESAFPYISTNIFDPLTNGNLEGVEDYICFDIDSKKICAMSLIDPAVLTSYLPDRIQLRNSASRIKRTSDNLKASGADVLILLSGYPFNGLNKLFNENSIDIAFTSDGNVDNGVIFEKGIHILQGTKDGKVAIVDLVLTETDTGLAYTYKYDFKSLSDYSPAPEIQEKITYYNDKLYKILSTVIGQTSTNFTTKKEEVRSKENSFANLVTDAMREHYNADIAIVNGGSIRGNRTYEAGAMITRKDIQSEFPFLNKGRLISIDGKYIYQAIENGLSTIENFKGRFLHVSGIQVQYCPEKPVGKRVISIEMNGKSLDKDQQYTLAANDFLIRGGDGFSMLENGKVIDNQNGERYIWEIVRNYIEQEETVFSKIEGRLQVKCN